MLRAICLMKQMQPKHISMIEAVTGTLIGFFVAVLIQVIVFPWFDIVTRPIENMQIAVIFTAVSIVRGYCVRRLFNYAEQYYGG